MKNDPREIKAKFTSKCKRCSDIILKGDTIFYWPIGKLALCVKCGESDYRESMALIADEIAYCKM